DDTVIEAGGEGSPEPHTLFIAERGGGGVQLLGSPRLNLVFNAPQPLIDALWTLLYGPRDPRPPPAPPHTTRRSPRPRPGHPRLNLVFNAPQPLIDALWTLLYGPRDPGPPPAPENTTSSSAGNGAGNDAGNDVPATATP